MQIEDMLDKIICGDCLTILKKLPDRSIDLVVTSPPYNKQGVGGELVKKVGYGCCDDNLKEEEYQKWQVDILNELYRVSDVCFYNHKIRYQNKYAIHPMEWILKTKWKLHQEIIWYRKITGNIRGWRCWSVDERIYWLVKSPPKEIPIEMAKWTSVWEIPPEKDIPEHPAPFPIEIPMRCIMLGSNENGVVLDPFIGSGTTAVACKKLNRHFIGIDINPDYCEFARKRLAEQPEPLYKFT
jgi:modification methylase